MKQSRGRAGPAGRWYFDHVYGAPSEWIWRALAGAAGLAWLVALLFLLGWLTTWPAQRLALAPDNYVEKCEGGAVDPVTNTAWNESLPCDEDHAAGMEQAATSAATAWIAYLEGGPENPPSNSSELALKNPFFAQWLDRNICSRGNTASERKASAWLIQQHHICSSWTSIWAVMPLTIWFGWIGSLLTVLLAVAGSLWLARRLWLMYDTRKAYRLLYGTNHRRR